MMDPLSAPIADRLEAFLLRYVGKPVQWGVDDCSAVFAPWLAENGIDVTLPAYGSKEEAHRIIEQHGDLAATWEAVLDGALFERPDEPQIGDIAIIETRRYGQAGVIGAHVGICAWRREQGGFSFIRPRSFVKIWAVSE